MILTHEQGSPVRTAQSLYIFDQSSKAIFVSNCNIDAKMKISSVLNTPSLLIKQG